MVEHSKPHFEVVAPVFQVTDVARSRAYYTEHLGFKVQFEWSDNNEDQPRYVILAHGNTELHVSQNKKLRPSIAYFFVDGIQEYYDTINGTDATIIEHIRDLPWQMREFEVEDPDGNKLIFGEHLSRIKSNGKT